MKPLILALLISSILSGVVLNAQPNQSYYKFKKANTVEVGTQPHFIYYDKTSRKAHVFCIGQDLNYDGVKNDVDVSPSWWTIDLANENKPNLQREFPFGSFNMFYFRAAVDSAERKIYIPAANKVYCYGLDDLLIQDSVTAANTIEGMACGFGSLFLSVNPTYGANGKVLVYTDGTLKNEIEVGVMAQNIAPYSNSKSDKAIAVVNIGSYGGTSSISFIEFDNSGSYTKTDVEVGITANSIYYSEGYVYVVCNSTNNTYKINAENYKIEKILHSGTAGWDGPRQMAFDGNYGYISDFSGDVRLVDLEKGVKDIVHIGGKIEGIALLPQESFLTAVQMNSDYSSNNTVSLYKKGAFKFDSPQGNEQVYDFCETCEKPEVVVGDANSGELYVLCVGDSTKGILPSLSKIQTYWPTMTEGTSSGFMHSQTIYQFNTYFKNPPTMSKYDNKLYVSTDKTILKLYLKNEEALLMDKYDFPAAFYLRAGKYYENEYVIGLNKEGYINVVGDNTNILKSDKELMDGAVLNDFASGNIKAGFVYRNNDKADLELVLNDSTRYFDALANSGKIFTDEDFNRIFFMNFTDISSDINEYDLTSMKITKTYNSGLLGSNSEKGIYSPETLVINNGTSDTKALAIPSPLGDMRFIDLTSGALSSIVPMPASTKAYVGNQNHFYTLLPELNLICMYGKLAGAVNDSKKQNDVIKFKVFPNPANSFTKIELAQDNGKAKLELISLTGEMIFETEFYGNSYQLNLNKNNISKGYYYIIITSGDKTGIEQLVKM